jgi:L-fuconolactonase
LHALAQHNCACDLLLSHTALPQAIDLVAAYPTLTFVLNHLAGARLRADGASEFARSIQPLAGMPNACMKVSGYMTARVDVSLHELPRVLSNYVDAAVHCFSAERLMFGSDWSVSAQAGEYAETVALLRSAAEHLSKDEQAAIWGASAARAYRLEQ